VLALLALSACSTSPPRQWPGKETEAVRDFVLVSELHEVDRVRRYDQMKYLYVNDFFVVFQTRRGDYLMEIRGRCTELRSRLWTSDMIDIRASTRVLYAGHDTIRGCVIDKIYELPEPQLEELRLLGDAPGEDEFIPQEN
jgi:hypothetical protein